MFVQLRFLPFIIIVRKGLNLNHVKPEFDDTKPVSPPYVHAFQKMKRAAAQKFFALVSHGRSL